MREPKCEAGSSEAEFPVISPAMEVTSFVKWKNHVSGHLENPWSVLGR